MNNKIYFDPGRIQGTHWTVIDSAPSKNGSSMYKCRCDCGTVKDVSAKNLKYGKSTSCGCIRKSKFKNKTKKKNNIDLTGKTFGNIYVIKKNSGHGVQTRWECRCNACGKIFEVVQYNLVNGSTKPCGCLRRKKSARMCPKYVGCVDGTNLSLIKSDKIFKSNTTGVRGVSFAKNVSKYHAYIQYKNKLYNLGYYSKLEDAEKARKIAEEKFFGKEK